MVKLLFEGRNGGKGWPLVGGQMSRAHFKQQIIQLEVKIIKLLQFDMQWAGPTPYSDRFLKLLRILQKNETQ